MHLVCVWRLGGGGGEGAYYLPSDAPGSLRRLFVDGCWQLEDDVAGGSRGALELLSIRWLQTQRASLCIGEIGNTARIRGSNKPTRKKTNG